MISDSPGPCRTCGDTGFIPCPTHKIEFDGWCVTCDAHHTTPKLHKVNCPDCNS